MGRTAERVREEVKVLLNQGFGRLEQATTEQTLWKRLDHRPLRAYYVALISRHFRSALPPWKRLLYRQARWTRLFEQQLPLIFETIICIQYLHNHLLDGKTGRDGQLTTSDRLLAANQLKEQLYRYIQKELPRSARAPVEETVRRVFEAVDWGQQLDHQAGGYQHFRNGGPELESLLPPALLKEIDLRAAAPFIDKIKRDLPVIYEEALHIYFHRIYLVCAYLFVAATRLIGRLLDVPKTYRTEMEQFACCYGIMRQLVNDNADYLPSGMALYTQGRGPRDTQSDLRRGLFTLPLAFYLANRAGEELYPYLLHPVEVISAEEQERIYADMLQSNALHQSIQNTRILTELALSYLDPHNEAACYLADTCGIAQWNKFIVPCHRHLSYRAYRQTAYYRRTKELTLQLRRQRRAWRAQVKPSWLGMPANPQRGVRVLREQLQAYQPTPSLG